MPISKYKEELTLDTLKGFEGQYFDRKSGKIDCKDIAKHISAFSNANGGLLAIGLLDNGDIEGFEDLGQTKLNEILKVPYDLLVPTPNIEVEIVDIENIKKNKDKIVLFHIGISTDRLIKLTNGKAYLRVGDSSKELSSDDILKLELDKGIRRAEDEIIEDATLDDIDLKTIEEFKSKMNLKSSTEEILKNRGLLKVKEGKVYLNKAGVLLFAKNPSQFFANARIRFIRYDGIHNNTGTRLNIIKDINIDGPLNTMILEAKEIVSAQLRDFNSLDPNTGLFKTIPEYPEFAWLEGIVNAVVHRDYFSMGEHIKIIMYDDRLEILSPGKLPNYVTLENLKTNRFSRNPKIARVMSEFGWVKEMNEGVKRIYEEMNNYFLDDPTFSEPNSNSVLLTLKNNIIMRRLRRDENISENWDKLWSTLSEYERKAITLAYSNDKITPALFAKYINRSTVSARKVLRDLVDKEIFSWYGTSKTDSKQYYTLKRK